MSETRRNGLTLRAMRTALAAAGVVALCAAAALPLFASEDLQGAWAMSQAAQIGAVDAAWSGGLDLRDVSNRSISREALRRGLKAGSQRELSAAAEVSRLEGLRALLEYIESLGLEAALRGESGDPLQRIEAAAQPAKSPKACPPARGISLPAPASSGPGLSRLQLSYAPGRLCRVPLRC